MQIFVVHGGLPEQEGVTLDDIMEIDRFKECVPEGELMEYLLWSDPMPEKGIKENSRGCACMFGPDVAERWLELNKLTTIVRSHECMERGYKEMFGGKLVTVFSASNYCGVVSVASLLVLRVSDVVLLFFH